MRQLRSLLVSIENLCWHDVQLIVVDDGSTDGTGDMMESWSKKILKANFAPVFLDRNFGPAKARNVGLKQAEGQIVAFTDSDCVVSNDWLDKLTRGLQISRGIVGVGGRVLPLHPRGLISRYCTDHRVLDPPRTLDYLVTANCCYYKQQVLDAGGFDEEICKPGGEDVALSIKLWKRGYSFVYDPEAVVFHDYRESLRSFIKTSRNYGFGCGCITQKYFGA